jgi:hypothetical protein
MADACSPAIRNIYLTQGPNKRIIRYRPATSPMQNVMSPQNVLWLKGEPSSMHCPFHTNNTAIFTPTILNRLYVLAGGLKNKKEAEINGMRMYPMRSEAKQKFDFSTRPRPRTSERPNIQAGGAIKSQYATLKAESSALRRKYNASQSGTGFTASLNQSGSFN